MKTITVKVVDQFDELVFEDVEHYYETRRGLEIVQERMCKTILTTIMKDNIYRYTVTETR